MEHDPIAESQLIQCILAGETRALEHFYERYADALYAYIYHACGCDREDAEDIWQETLLAAIRGLDTFHSQSRLFTWLCAIAHRKIADYYRKLGRPVETITEDQQDDLFILVDQSPLPEDWIQEKTTKIRVVTTLQKLPDEYRYVLVARYAHEESVAEISRKLGKSYKATESILSRARFAFKNAFIEADGD